MALDPLVSLFDRHARGYDLQVPLERRALRAAAALAGPLGAARVIDLAAGTGALAAALVAHGANPDRLTAVDAAPRMIARARVRLGSGPTLIVADARAVPLADRCADVVAMGYLLHLLDPDARADVLREAFRLLRPEGLLIAVVHGSPRGGAGTIYRAGWRAVNRLLPGAILGRGPMTDLSETVAAAGFEVGPSVRLRDAYFSHVLRAHRPAAEPDRRN